MSFVEPAARHWSRRDSFGLAAWLMVGASCSRSSDQSGASRPPAAMASDPLAHQFYQQRGWRPAWTPVLATSLQQAIGDARRHGLDPGSFAPKEAGGNDPIQHDVDLTLAAL